MKQKKIPMGVGRPLERTGHKSSEQLSTVDVKVSVFEEFNAESYVPPVADGKSVETKKVAEDDGFWPAPEFDEEFEEKLDRADVIIAEESVSVKIENAAEPADVPPEPSQEKQVRSVGQLLPKRKVRLDKKLRLDKTDDEDAADAIETVNAVYEQIEAVEMVIQDTPQIDEIDGEVIEERVDVSGETDGIAAIEVESIETQVAAYESDDDSVSEIVLVASTSPLINSILAGDVDQAKQALANGGDITESHQGKSALDLAVELQDMLMIETLMFHKFKQSYVMPIAESVADGGKDAVDPSLNERDEKGQTLLMRLIEEARLDEAKELIERGADVSLVDNIGATALILASTKGDLELVKMLVKAGSDINAQEEDGYSALHYATFSGNGNIASYLVNEAGIDVNLKDRFGRTVIMWYAPIANFGNQMAVIENLINHGADIGLKNDFGQTLYDIAVAHDQTGLVDRMKLVNPLEKAMVDVGEYGSDGFSF